MRARFTPVVGLLLALGLGCQKSAKMAAPASETAPATEAPATAEKTGTSMTLPSVAEATPTQPAPAPPPPSAAPTSNPRPNSKAAKPPLATRVILAPPVGPKGAVAAEPHTLQPVPAPLPSTALAETAPSSDTDAVDRALDSMKQASIAFNVPTEMNIHDAAKIQLLLSLHQSVEDLQKSVTAPGGRDGAQVKVSNRMEARLTGPHFAITAITDEEQAIASVADTEWDWDVAPQQTGTLSLHLTLTALFDVDGVKTRRTIRTFDRTIEVRVTGIQTTTEFVKKYWQWLWTALLIPIVGWLIRRRKAKP